MNPCISPGKIVCEVSTASPECTADWTSAKPTTNDKDLNTKHHDHAPSTNRGGRKRSATYKDYPMRTRDHTNYHNGNNQGQNYTGGKARIIPTHPKPSYSNVAMILSPTTQIAQPPSISSASDMNTEQDQYHTTNSEQNQSQHHNIQDSDMTQDRWPPVGHGGAIPSPSTASPIGRVKRHLITNGGTAEWPPAETANDVLTTSAASPIERVKWPVTNTADRSLQNETMRPMDVPPLTGSGNHPTYNPREQLPVKVLRLNNGKRRKVGDTAPNRDAPPPPLIIENTPRMEPMQSHIPKAT